jgi:hypothetical protein
LWLLLLGLVMVVILLFDLLLCSWHSTPLHRFFLGSRLQSGPINDALRKDFFLMSEGLFAIPIKLPGTKFSNALQVSLHI